MTGASLPPPSVPPSPAGGVLAQAAASIAPTMMIADTALVTDISGVCSAGVTFHTTW